MKENQNQDEKNKLLEQGKNIWQEIINESTNTKNYQGLYNKLNDVIVETDAFLLISNQEDDMEDAGDGVKSNPIGEGKELLKKDATKF